ncbi:hypothetical protein QZH41_018495 [Actinostola sp. cb2023]|nr:hypothetical protein QZH41_018495 [Actinostola sp. cb2023]
MHLNMALVLRYFNLLSIPETLLASSGNLWLTAPVLSLPLSSAMPRLKRRLAIVHAFHKFDQLLFGKSGVIVHSDHKSLETIFKRPLASAPRRLQSMMLTLQRYTFQSLKLTILTSLGSKTPRTLKDIRTAASTDPEQIVLHSLIESGWPTDKAGTSELARPYWSDRHELTTHDGLLFKQDRVIIPSSLRHTMLHKLHAAHRGDFNHSTAI